VDKLIKNKLIGVNGITETLNEDINDIFSKFGFDDPKAVIEYGIKVAVRGNGHTWRFVYNRLEYWRKLGAHTVQQASQIEQQQMDRGNPRQPRGDNIVSLEEREKSKQKYGF
jgi:Replication initiation and membrane attachment protein (DnaB).